MKEAPITIITPTIVWPQAKTQSCPSTENWIKDLLSVALPIRTRPSSPTVSLSNQETSPQASYPYPSEGRQNENHSHRKLIKLITWTTACLTQSNYEPCLVEPPKMDWSWWRVLTKRGPLEKDQWTSVVALFQEHKRRLYTWTSPDGQYQN